MPTSSFDTQLAPSAPKPEDVKDADGTVIIDEQTSGRFTKFAPANADQYENDVDYRAAVLQKVKEDREERRFSGKPVGNKAAWTYMDSVIDGSASLSTDSTD